MSTGGVLDLDRGVLVDVRSENSERALAVDRIDALYELLVGELLRLGTASLASVEEMVGGGLEDFTTFSVAEAQSRFPATHSGLVELDELVLSVCFFADETNNVVVLSHS